MKLSVVLNTVFSFLPPPLTCVPDRVTDIVKVEVNGVCEFHVAVTIDYIVVSPEHLVPCRFGVIEHNRLVYPVLVVVFGAVYHCLGKMSFAAKIVCACLDILDKLLRVDAVGEHNLFVILKSCACRVVLDKLDIIIVLYDKSRAVTVEGFNSLG